MTNIVVQKDLSDYLSGTGYLYSSFPYSKLTLSAITELIAIYAEPRYVEDREWVKNNFLPKSDGTMHV